MQSKWIKVNNNDLELFIINEESNCNYVYIFLNGINARANIIEYLSNKINDNACVITFNNIAHFNNKEKHTDNVKKYVNYTINVINEIKQLDFVINKKIIIIGESFGASLGLLISTINNQIADLFFLWNAPTKITKNKEMKNQFSTSLKTLCSYLFKIETFSEGYFDPRLTSNKSVIRLNNLEPKRMVSNKLNLVCWKTMKKTKRIIKSKLNNNVYIVQSMQDILCDCKFFKNIHNNHLIIYNTGYHILSLEENESINLFNDLKAIIRSLEW